MSTLTNHTRYRLERSNVVKLRGRETWRQILAHVGLSTDSTAPFITLAEPVEENAGIMAILNPAPKPPEPSKSQQQPWKN